MKLETSVPVKTFLFNKCCFINLNFFSIQSGCSVQKASESGMVKPQNATTTTTTTKFLQVQVSQRTMAMVKLGALWFAVKLKFGHL